MIWDVFLCSLILRDIFSVLDIKPCNHFNIYSKITVFVTLKVNTAHDFYIQNLFLSFHFIILLSIVCCIYTQYLTGIQEDWIISIKRIDIAILQLFKVMMMVFYIDHSHQCIYRKFISYFRVQRHLLSNKRHTLDSSPLWSHTFLSFVYRKCITACLLSVLYLSKDL